jgi:phosphoribosylanthranilate isomerase
MLIKVCGITRAIDGRHAVEQGATAIGFVFWPRSPRAITPERAAAIVDELPSSVTKVGVFVDESLDRIRAIAKQVGLTTVQLHGDEPPSYGEALEWPVIRAVSIAALDEACEAWGPATALLVDNIDPQKRGGTGIVVDWAPAAAAAMRRRVVLAGGLTPENVSSAIRAVHPFGVDVSSGVEAAPGIKDVDKVARFVANARRAYEECR